MRAMGDLLDNFREPIGRMQREKRNDDDFNPDMTLWSKMILDKIPTGR